MSQAVGKREIREVENIREASLYERDELGGRDMSIKSRERSPQITYEQGGIR